MTEPASDWAIKNAEGFALDGENITAHVALALISRIRKEQEDKAVMARALEHTAQSLEEAAKFIEIELPDCDGTISGVREDAAFARAALTGSSTIISDMEAEITRLKAEVRELERVLERGANAILYRELSK